MPQINCQITLDLIWTAICAICEEKSVTTSAMTDAKLYVSEVTLSIQDNAKLIRQLKIGFNRTINWNKYLWKLKTLAQIWYLDFLISPNYQGVKRLYVLSFENEEL